MKENKFNKMWMGKQYKYPIQSPYKSDHGHWFLRVGKVVIEATTRAGCLKESKLGEKKILKSVMKKDIATFGG